MVIHCLILIDQKLTFLDLFPSKAAASTAVRCVKLAFSLFLFSSRVLVSWVPRGDWGCSSDPSGRSVSIHQAAYGETN